MTMLDAGPFADLLKVLSYADDEFTSVCHQVPGDAFRAAVVPSGTAPQYVATLPTQANVWFGVNPTRGPAGRGRKGRAEDVTRLAALFCDLDAYGTGPTSLDAAREIVDELSDHLGGRPGAIVTSGHGLHPYWPISRESARKLTNAEAAELLTRFGQLAESVARKHDCRVDNVFNLDRILRVPGTRNHKVLV